MKKLSSSERNFLHRKAHHLKPLVRIGNSGIIQGAIEIVKKALNTRHH